MTSESATPIEISLSARLDTAAAPDLLDRLQAASGSALKLDGAKVELLGGRCLEHLLAAKAVWSRHGQAFDLVSPSDALSADLKTFGLTPRDLQSGAET